MDSASSRAAVRRRDRGRGRHLASTLANAICLHEEDYGLLWKHINWRTNYTEARRSRRLVISFIATVGNYEYGFYWYFYQDGSLQFEVKLTGVISNGAAEPGEQPKWGEMVAPQVYAPIHQHFFNMRLDMMVDGPNNSVYEVNTVSDPSGPDNPHHNAFHTEATLLETESKAQRIRRGGITCQLESRQLYVDSLPPARGRRVPGPGDVRARLGPGRRGCSFALDRWPECRRR
jgi:Cu2+-containing amine oxidase